MYYDRAFELLNTKNYREILIYGLGTCINSAVNLSLIIVDGMSNLEINKIETKTIDTIDDIVEQETGKVIYFLMNVFNDLVYTKK